MPSTFHVKNATTYEQVMGRFSRQLAPKFLDWVGETGGTILDVGCGTGSLIEELLQRNAAAKITAMDYEERFVEACKEAYQEELRVLVEQGDAENLRYRDAAFETTLSMLTLHFIQDPVQALREMRRVTKPGGMVASTVWEAGKLADHELFWGAVARVNPQVAELRNNTRGNGTTRADGLVAAFREAGLRQITLERCTISMDYENAHEYWKPYGHDAAKTNKFLSKLTSEQVAELETQVRTAYLDGEPDGPRHFPAVALAVKAVH